MLEKLVTKASEATEYKIEIVDGKPITPASLTQFPRGETMMMLKCTVPAGYHSPAHQHEHESIGYMIKGKVETEVDGKKFIVGPGDMFIHPRRSMHRQRVIEDSIWLEIKSPAPDRRSPEGVWVND